eukprot:17412-Heterococcus_DN1.PRE.1
MIRCQNAVSQVCAATTLKPVRWLPRMVRARAAVWNHRSPATCAAADAHCTGCYTKPARADEHCHQDHSTSQTATATSASSAFCVV